MYWIIPIGVLVAAYALCVFIDRRYNKGLNIPALVLVVVIMVSAITFVVGWIDHGCFH